MTSLLKTFQNQNSLPVSQTTPDSKTSAAPAGMLRRRLSFDQIQPPTISATTAWALRSSKSVSSMGGSATTSVRNWWASGWAWILSRKPVFAQDLEMNQEETSVLGCHNKGSWRHVLYKFRSEIRKLIGSDQGGLPQTIRPSSYSSAI